MSQLPVNSRLDYVALRVGSVTRTGNWLEDVLGLWPLGRNQWGTPSGLPLVALREVPGAGPMPRTGRPGLYHYALLLPTPGDLGRFLLHLEALGEPWAAADHLFSEALYLNDPDGITVVVYAARPREGWIRRGADLGGAVDPLDRETLVAAAGATPWSGIPAGSSMGHLHFYVGDLVEAERFYVSALGFEVSTRIFPGALFVAAGGYHHHVGVNVWAAGRPAAGPGDAGLDEWRLVLPDAASRAELSERAKAAGVELATDTGDLVATDTWGLRVRVALE